MCPPGTIFCKLCSAKTLLFEAFGDQFVSIPIFALISLVISFFDTLVIQERTNFYIFVNFPNFLVIGFQFHSIIVREQNL